MTETKFETIEPKILYFGTPVAVISSLNEDGATNLAPISSFWALGWTFLLGLNESTKTADNVRRHPECVVNLPDPEMWPQVEILAPLTGKNPVPEIKAKSKYHYERDKFQAAALTPLPSELVKPARVQECPVQMEARVRAVHQLGGEKLQEIGGACAVEVEILRVHTDRQLILDGHYVNPAKWSPLIYNFRHYYRLAPEELGKTFRAEK
jgi:flavin reductase (DIM6/NTAB) family NADH-FMN oxidoreductase RutF